MELKKKNIRIVNLLISYKGTLWRDLPKLERIENRNNWEKLSITNNLIIFVIVFILFYFICSLPWKFWLQLGGKYSFFFLVDV